MYGSMHKGAGRTAREQISAEPIPRNIAPGRKTILEMYKVILMLARGLWNNTILSILMFLFMVLKKSPSIIVSIFCLDLD